MRHSALRLNRISNTSMYADTTYSAKGFSIIPNTISEL